MSLDNQPHRFINDVDHDTRDNIVKLDQKLRGLKAEIVAKLASASWSETEKSAEYTNNLNHLSQEIDKALQGINTLVNLVNADDAPVPNPLYESKEMHEFSSVLAENLEKMSKIKEQF